MRIGGTVDDGWRIPESTGTVSLVLGVVSLSPIGIGLCSLSSPHQGWRLAVATPLSIRAASSAFRGPIALVLVVGRFIGRASKSAAAAGLLLMASAMGLFLVILRALAGWHLSGPRLKLEATEL